MLTAGISEIATGSLCPCCIIEALEDLIKNRRGARLLMLEARCSGD